MSIASFTLSKIADPFGWRVCIRDGFVGTWDLSIPRSRASGPQQQGVQPPLHAVPLSSSMPSFDADSTTCSEVSLLTSGFSLFPLATYTNAIYLCQSPSLLLSWSIDSFIDPIPTRQSPNSRPLTADRSLGGHHGPLALRPTGIAPLKRTKGPSSISFRSPALVFPITTFQHVICRPRNAGRGDYPRGSKASESAVDRRTCRPLTIFPVTISGCELEGQGIGRSATRA